MAPKGKKSNKKHIVVFQDREGNVLKTAFVSDGQAAQAPEVPKKIGETKHHNIVFQGWSEDFSEVRGNMKLSPVYEKQPKKYLVMYYHENGKILGMESVPYGEAAKKPYQAEKPSDEEYNYPFLGWNCSLEKIEGDTNAKAVFGRVRKNFRVCFFHEDGSLLKEERVIYGKAAHAPAEVAKKKDETYHYTFAGWSESFDYVTKNLNIKAQFHYIYNEYTLKFYNENELEKECICHYHDKISFPDLYKKGYTLIWDHMDSLVTKDDTFKASWEFTNRKNKIIETKQGIFEITDPSKSDGKVKCLHYNDENNTCIHLPARVKINDYYYVIDSIGGRCFSKCEKMNKLVLSDRVRKIDSYGIFGCRHLKEIVLGKKIQKIGEKAFAGNQHLKKITIENHKFKRSLCHKMAFSGLGTQVEIFMK